MKLFKRSALDRDRDEEMAAHLAEAVDYYRAQGMSEAESTRMARLRFGNPRAYREKVDARPRCFTAGEGGRFPCRSVRRPAGSKWPTLRHDPGPGQPEIPIGPPDLADASFLEEHQARRIDIRQLAPAEPIERLPDFDVMGGVERQQLETGKVTEGQAEGAGGLLTQPVQEPAVGLGDDRER